MSVVAVGKDTLKADRKSETLKAHFGEVRNVFLVPVKLSVDFVGVKIFYQHFDSVNFGNAFNTKVSEQSSLFGAAPCADLQIGKIFNGLQIIFAAV